MEIGCRIKVGWYNMCKRGERCGSESILGISRRRFCRRNFGIVIPRIGRDEIDSIYNIQLMY